MEFNNMSQDNNLREQFASRAGFILMTAGCAIGLGNVWRFSYVAGEYGGGWFLILYLLFLAILGFPVMLMELAIGRAGRSTFPGAFRNLQKPDGGFKWHKPVYLLFLGNLILLMFYSVITGWLLIYAYNFITGKFNQTTPEICQNIFVDMLAAPASQIIGMAVAVAITVLVCLGGVRKTIEKVIKVMMGGLFILLLMLVINSLLLPGAGDGIAFFLKPNWHNFVDKGILETAHAAMAQAFFTLSLGIGSIAVCGSYTNRDSSLPKEGLWIILLDTIVAVTSGLIIFPACQSFGIEADSGPSLVFITLPNVFNNMAGGVFWGGLFFVFLCMAALSTLIAVFENLVAFGMEEMRWSRVKSGMIFGVILLVFALPCIFGFNIWQHIHPLGGESSILDLEDFIVSDNLLPLGAFFMTIFCMNRCGWHNDGFYKELSIGNGRTPGKLLTCYLRWILPVIILLIWLIGILKKIFPEVLDM